MSDTSCVEFCAHDFNSVQIQSRKREFWGREICGLSGLTLASHVLKSSEKNSLGQLLAAFFSVRRTRLIASRTKLKTISSKKSNVDIRQKMSDLTKPTFRKNLDFCHAETTLIAPIQHVAIEAAFGDITRWDGSGGNPVVPLALPSPHDATGRGKCDLRWDHF